MLIGLGNLGACGCGGMCGGMCGGNCPGAAQVAAAMSPPPPTAPVSVFGLGAVIVQRSFPGFPAPVTIAPSVVVPSAAIPFTPTVSLPPPAGPGVLYASDADRFRQECTGVIRARVGFAYTTLRCCSPTGTCGPAVRFDTGTGARLGF